MKAAESVGAPLAATRRAGEVFETGAAREFAHENLTAVAKLYAQTAAARGAVDGGSGAAAFDVRLAR